MLFWHQHRRGRRRSAGQHGRRRESSSSKSSSAACPNKARDGDRGRRTVPCPKAAPAIWTHLSQVPVGSTGGEQPRKRPTKSTVGSLGQHGPQAHDARDGSGGRGGCIAPEVVPAARSRARVTRCPGARGTGRARKRRRRRRAGETGSGARAAPVPSAPVAFRLSGPLRLRLKVAVRSSHELARRQFASASVETPTAVPNRGPGGAGRQRGAGGRAVGGGRRSSGECGTAPRRCVAAREPRLAGKLRATGVTFGRRSLRLHEQPGQRGGTEWKSARNESTTAHTRFGEKLFTTI